MKSLRGQISMCFCKIPYYKSHPWFQREQEKYIYPPKEENMMISFIHIWNGYYLIKMMKHFMNQKTRYIVLIQTFRVNLATLYWWNMTSLITYKRRASWECLMLLLQMTMMRSRFPNQEGMPDLWGGVGLNKYFSAPTRFQPRIVANPALDYGCPTCIL